MALYDCYVLLFTALLFLTFYKKTLKDKDFMPLYATFAQK